MTTIIPTSIKTAAALGVAGALVAGCGSTTGSDKPVAPSTLAASTPTSSAVSTSPSPTGEPTTNLKSTTLATLKAFLQTWQHQGLTKAGLRYLAPQDRLPAGQTGPRLLRYKILSSKVTSKDSQESITLEVDLDLHFGGATGAWGQGRNTRFVTGTRDTSTGSVRLALATSP